MHEQLLPRAFEQVQRVIVPKADSLVGGGVSLDRLDRLLHQHCYQRFLVGSVDSFLGVICRHVPTVCGSLLEAQSVRLQASLFPVGTLVPLPTLWHSNGARILAPRNQQTEQAISALVLVRRLKTDWTLH